MRKQEETRSGQSTSESSPTGGELTRSSRQSDSRGKRSTRRAPERRPIIRVLVMSDHALTREAICLLIRGQSALRLVGQAQNDSSDPAATRHKADVILIDLDSSRHNGFDFLSKIIKKARGA